MSDKPSRRNLLQLAGIGVAASLAGTQETHAQAVCCPTPANIRYQLGLASYTLRKFDLSQTLAMTQRVGLKNIAFKSFHLAMDSTPAQIRDVVAKVKQAGLNLYGGGVISLKTRDEIDQAFDYAKAAGMNVIIGVPAHELLGLVEKKVQQYDIKVAIHNHGPGDKLYPTPAEVYEKVKDLDRRIGICHDIGHTMRLGIEPCELTAKVADRLHDVHLKDVSAKTAKGTAVELGRGVIDIPRFMRTLAQIGYAGMVSFEYEKDADDPVAGLAESVGYARGVMAAI